MIRLSWVHKFDLEDADEIYLQGKNGPMQLFF